MEDPRESIPKYLNCGMNNTDIAKKLGITRYAVNWYLKKNNLKNNRKESQKMLASKMAESQCYSYVEITEATGISRSELWKICRRGKDIERVHGIGFCKHCGVEFKKQSPSQIYCSDKCRLSKVCPICGEWFVGWHSTATYCSNRCAKIQLRVSQSEYKERLERMHGGRLLPISEYKGYKRKVTVRCLDCGKKTTKAAGLFIFYGAGCNYCTNKSNGERDISLMLGAMGLDYKREFSFEDLKRTRNLRFDFAVFKDGDLDFLIEVDGEQHFRPVELFGGVGSFEEQVIKDAMKNAYAEDNGIKLLRVRYDQLHVAEEMIRGFINRMD